MLAVEDKIGTLGDDPESLAKAVRVRELVNDCRRIHAALFVEVCEANEKFRAAQARAFAARRVEDIPDPEEGVLVPMLGASIGAVEACASALGAAFAAPSPPGLLDLPRFWAEIAEETLTEDLTEQDARDLEPLEQLPPLYEEALLQDVDQWLREQAVSQRELRIDHAVRQLAAGKSPAAARCGVLLFLHHYQSGTPGRPDAVSPLLVFRGERGWPEGAMAGDLLSLRPRHAAKEDERSVAAKAMRGKRLG